MIDASPPHIEMPPAAVTDGITVLRVACVQWVPDHLSNDAPVSIENAVEHHACDTVLGKDNQLPAGAVLGVGMTLFVVALYAAARPLLRFPALTRMTSVLLYLCLLLVAVPIGWTITDFANILFGEYWPPLQHGWISLGCIVAAAATLAGQRWRTQSVGAQ